LAKVTYIQPDGAEQTIEAKSGWSVMEGAVKNRIRGIDADCGGACACATCHVFVDQAWTSKIEPMQEMEKTMLDFAEGVESNSRLSCQIRVTEALDGFTVRMPKSQH